MPPKAAALTAMLPVETARLPVEAAMLPAPTAKLPAPTARLPAPTVKLPAPTAKLPEGSVRLAGGTRPGIRAAERGRTSPVEQPWNEAGWGKGGAARGWRGV
jgi:hypothetical protein